MTNPVMKMGFILVLEISRGISSASTLCMGYVPHVLIFSTILLQHGLRNPLLQLLTHFLIRLIMSLFLLLQYAQEASIPTDGVLQLRPLTT